MSNFLYEFLNKFYFHFSKLILINDDFLFFPSDTILTPKKLKFRKKFTPHYLIVLINYNYSFHRWLINFMLSSLFIRIIIFRKNWYEIRMRFISSFFRGYRQAMVYFWLLRTSHSLIIRTPDFILFSNNLYCLSVLKKEKKTLKAINFKNSFFNPWFRHT